MRREADKRREAFRAWLTHTGQNVRQVADKSNVPKTTLYSFLAGDAVSLKASTEARVAAAYGLSVDAIFGSSTAQPVAAPVRGKIGVGFVAMPFDVATETPYSVPLPPGADVTEEYVAYEIEGFSAPPFARPGFVLIFKAEPVDPATTLGFLVLADLADGQRLCRTLRRGFEPGRWNLESWDGSELIENVQLTACRPFVALTPGKLAR